MEYLETLKIVSARQHGFIPDYSTKSGIINCVQNILDEMDTNNFLVATIFHLTRAFDTVDKTPLASKHWVFVDTIING